MGRRNPLCAMCNERPARRIASEFKYAHEAAFCTHRCAVDWALVEVFGQLNNGSLHECDGTNKFEIGDWCHECKRAAVSRTGDKNAE